VRGRGIEGGLRRQQGFQRMVHFTRGCRMLLGCGYVELRAVAVRRGRSVIRAIQETCGDDARCVPPRRFAVTVIVS
jgi:hypothetical protein